jgi:periplasmic nitrate reductase NapD
MNPASADREVHIAGLIVHARPDCAAAVAAALAQLPDTEVRAEAEGRLVVVCEGASGAEILALIERMRDLPGVLNVALAYQHAESAAAMDELVKKS